MSNRKDSSQQNRNSPDEGRPIHPEMENPLEKAFVSDDVTGDKNQPINDQKHGYDFSKPFDFDNLDEVDDQLLDIQSQLRSDARYLSEVYPPANNSKLEELIYRCQATVVQRSSDAVPTTRPASKSFTKPQWLPVTLAFCLGFFIVGSLALFWNVTGESANDQVFNRLPSRTIESTPMTVTSMPTELLQASQPELEAIYDQMGLVSTSAEF